MSNHNGHNQTKEVSELGGKSWVLLDPRGAEIGQNETDRVKNSGESNLVIEEAIRSVLTHVGEDPDREGLAKTPHRVAKMYDEILAGYGMDPETIVNGALFDVQYDEMIIVKDIEFFSMCEHHMLPFYGRAHVAYIPGERIIGLSKIPRIVEMFARRLQVQERMTRQIGETIEDILMPQGVAVVVEGSHMCSMMRGVKKEHPRMVTSTMLGAFKDNALTRSEFMGHLRRPSVSMI